MQCAQIGSPQFEQVSRVSTSGWLTHAGTTGAESVAIAFSIYEETSITVRPTLGPLTWWPGPVWNRGTLETVLLGAPPAHRAPQISSRRLTGLMATSRTTAAVLIVGSGPAGLTSALYAARANLHPIVIEGAEAGGQLMLTTEVENYPGFPTGILGPELMAKMREQAERFGAEFITADATKVDLSGSPFRAWVDDEEYSGKALIISTGAKAKMLGLDSERKLLGRGVSTCATCDGFFFRSKDRAFANPKIDFAWNSVVEQVHGDQSVSGVRLRNLEDNSESDLGVAGVFVAIGHLPNTELFADQVELDEDGYIKVNPPGTATSVDGVFAAGDVVDHVYRQAVTAAGTGCAAAIDAERWLEAHGYDSGATTDNWD